MKHTLSLLTLVAASSAFAQTAPNISKKPVLQHSVEVAYVASSSTQAAVDDIEGYSLAARAYVWQHVFVALEYYTGMTDTAVPSPADIDYNRFGYGLGATFQVGSGQFSASYTLGKMEEETDASGTEKSDQDRISLTYAQAYGNSLTVSLGVTQFLNDGVDDATAVILGVGYDFRNGFSVGVSYSPDSADIGDDGVSEDTFSLGAKYSF
ncbi:MAG: porin [Opitutia bacterium]